uniref:Methyltransferase domain-containing protein n=1 Tax=Setaria italica TaxID=4555 RepID=K3Y3H4_SETIT
MAATPASGGAYSCECMEALTTFLGRQRPLLEAHVVNFFKDRMWELVDAEWMECLRREPVESLLKLPSGCVQEHWPATLREFVLTARSLVVPREQKAPYCLHYISSLAVVSSHLVKRLSIFLIALVPDIRVASIGTVLAQGMNSKKKHEIENLAAMVHAIAKSCGAKTVVDVGSGQGYLTQALSFEYQLPVVAIDASSHHASVTIARAERIKKHYAAKCDTLAAVTQDACKDNHGEHVSETKACTKKSPQILEPTQNSPPLILAGLHACGDLSVNMLRVFVSCEQVKALDSYEDTNTCSGFPMSKAAKLSKLVLGKSIRDLACQSAERWRSLTVDIALQNFDVHAFQAAFEMAMPCKSSCPSLLHSALSFPSVTYIASNNNRSLQ